MSLVRVLSAVSKVFEKLMRYLWEEIDEWKGSHLVRWEVGSKRLNLARVSCSGISNIRAGNKALLATWLWLFHHEFDT